jgi:SsrA-binding protein
MKIINRRATYDHTLLDQFEAGIQLVGAEVKAIRQGKADLSGSFIKIINNQAFLVNAKIYPYEYARPEIFDSGRTRKLLLHKKEIISLKSKMDGASLTLVPVSLYTKQHLIKIQIALAKPKKKFEKKESLKQKDIDREIEEALKNKL